MDIEYTHPLLKPKTFNGETITEIAFRLPEGGDIRRAQAGKGSEIDRTFRLLADLSERPLELIDRLDPRDLHAIQKWLEPIIDPQDPPDGSGS